MKQAEFFSCYKIHLIALFFCFALQAFLFRTFVQEKILWSYPAYHDQAGYLVESYTLYENLKTGFTPTFKRFFSGLPYPHPQGFLLQVESALFFFLLKPGRLTAYSLNLIHFFFFQTALFLALKKISHRWSVAWIGIGLILSIKTTFNIPGGITDFRPDFAAFCLYGLYLSFVMLSDTFLSFKTSVIISLIGSILVFTRTFSLIYLTAIWACFSAILAVLLILKKMPSSQIVPRLKNIFISFVLICLFTSPFLWLVRKPIYNYYFVGHLSGIEKNIRAQEWGNHTLMDHIQFYPNSILQHHIGRNSAIHMLLIVVFCFLVNKFYFRKTREEDRQEIDQFEKEMDIKIASIFLVLSFLLPMGLLTANTAKSPVVANVLTVPIMIGISLLLSIVIMKNNRAIIVQNLVVVIILSLGIYRQLKGYGGRGPFLNRSADVKQIVRMYEDIAEHCAKSENLNPALSVNYVTDYLNGSVLMAIAYEKLGIILNVSGRLGHAIFEISKDEAVNEIGRSDIVVLMDRPDEKMTYAYPFDESMERVMPIIRQTVKKRFKLLGHYPYQEGNGFAVYIRP